MKNITERELHNQEALGLFRRQDPKEMEDLVLRWRKIFILCNGSINYWRETLLSVFDGRIEKIKEKRHIELKNGCVLVLVNENRENLKDRFRGSDRITTCWVDMWNAVYRRSKGKIIDEWQDKELYGQRYRI